MPDPRSLLIWIFQTGEPLSIDGADARPMRAMNLSNALVQAGHSVVLWSSAFNHQEKRHRSRTITKERVESRLEIRLIPSRGYHHHIGIDRLVDHAQLALNLKKALTKEKSVPDVAFVGYPPIETAAVLMQWLAKRGVPSLLDVKDQWPSLFLNPLPKPLRPLARLALFPYFYMARRSMKYATGISSMANDFLKWTLEIAGRQRSDMDGVFALTSPLGQVSSEQLAKARMWWDEQGVSDDGRARVCFVGSFMSIFDFRPVQEAAKKMSQDNKCEFVICGDGSSAAKLQAMMAGMFNVRFAGWVDRPKIEALAERCQASLAPYVNIDNFTKNIPNKIIDALSLGLPVLSPLQGEVAQLIKEKDVGMSYGESTGNTLHECISVLIQNSALQQRMAKNARELYTERFSYEMVYRGLVKHLEMLANSKA